MRKISRSRGESVLFTYQLKIQTKKGPIYCLKTDRLQTKIGQLFKNTDPKETSETDANISGQQYPKDNLISNSNIYYVLTEGRHIGFNKY